METTPSISGVQKFQCLEAAPCCTAGVPPATVVEFAYDYRSRRYCRSAPDADHMYCISDSGLSIQKYNVEHASSLLTAESLTTEFIRDTTAC